MVRRELKAIKALISKYMTWPRLEIFALEELARLAEIDLERAREAAEALVAEGVLVHYGQFYRRQFSGDVVAHA